MAFYPFIHRLEDAKFGTRPIFVFFADLQGEDGPGVAEPGVGAVAVEMVGPCASPEPSGGGAVGSHHRGTEHHGTHASSSQGEGNPTEGMSTPLKDVRFSNVRCSALFLTYVFVCPPSVIRLSYVQPKNSWDSGYYS